MAGLIKIQAGSEVPVVLQLADGASDQFPQAEIRDNEANLLTTLNLIHQASGVYVPASAYVMPNENFIKITYIVYSDAGHLTESAIHQRDIDVFYKVVPDDYKATGFAVPNEYDAVLATLATEANATSNKNEVIGEVNNNEIKIDAVLGDLVSLDTDLQLVKAEADKIPAMIIDLQFLKDIEGGDWERDGTQMIFSKPGGAELARFNLFKFDGTPATEADVEVAKRERV